MNFQYSEHNLAVYCQISFIALCLSVGIWFGLGWIKQVTKALWTLFTHLCVLIVLVAVLLSNPQLSAVLKQTADYTTRLIQSVVAKSE